jgi:excisionase family DNA binding protein
LTHGATRQGSVTVGASLIPLKDAARRLGISPDHAYELARTGILPAGVVVRLGRLVKVNPEKLDAWMDEGGQPLSDGWRHAPEASPTTLPARKRGRGRHVEP